MIKANIEHKNLVTGILLHAFKNNQSVNYIIRQDKDRLRRISALMDYSFEMCLLFGDVLLSDNMKACALVIYPQNKKVSLRTIWLDIKLIFQSVGIGGITKVLKREGRIKDIQPKIPMGYLWFIGVSPEDQHSGYGSQLLRDIIDHTELQQLPVFLETSTIHNIPWYQSFGFDIYDELDFNYTLYFLEKKLDKL